MNQVENHVNAVLDEMYQAHVAAKEAAGEELLQDEFQRFVMRNLGLLYREFLYAHPDTNQT